MQDRAITLAAGPMVILLLLSVVNRHGLALADSPNRVALVVEFGNGRIETHCVSFDGNEITGTDLLARSGLGVVMDTSSSMGVTVCQIEEEGCAYPAEPCFCQCTGGGECAYWNYFYREPGEAGWTYSALGAALRKAKPGSVEGWVWGDGHTAPAGDRPAEMTFEFICVPPTRTPTETTVPPTVLPATTTASPTSGQSPTPPPTRSSAIPTATTELQTPTPAAVANTGQGLLNYWPFGLMVIGLVTIGAFVWLRRT